MYWGRLAIRLFPRFPVGDITMNGNELKNRRELLGLSVDELAEKFTCDQKWLTDLESMPEEIPFAGLIDMALELLEIDKGIQLRKPVIEEKLKQIYDYCATSDVLLATNK